MDEIENITDQIELFSNEIGFAIQGVQRTFKCSEHRATEIVSLGLKSMFIEVLYHKLGKLSVDDLTVFSEITKG